MLLGAIAFVVLILVPVAIGVVIAERRLIVGMGRWGSSGSDGGAG